MDKVGLLTIIPIEEIATNGINYIRHKMSETAVEKTQWENFGFYFRKTWLRKYNPRLWNVSYLIEHEDRDRFLINRTNNPLGRYNMQKSSAKKVAAENLLWIGLYRC